MKLYKYAFALLAGAMMTFTSCDINDYPVFSDSDAFVAFTSASLSLQEQSTEELEIPVMLTSLAGLETTCEFEISSDENGAKEGVHYQVLNSSKSLTFTKDAPTQYIRIKAIDNDQFGGDKKFTLTLKSENVNLGKSSTCTVTVEDDEHPLSFILGAFTAKGISYFNGEQEWNVTIEKDADDLSKVWIGNLVPGGSSLKVYGTVNEDKTELHIPVGQDIAASSSYPLIALEGFYGADGDEDIPTGGYITFLISEDGTLTAMDWFGSHVYSDTAGTSAGWYNIMQSDIVFKKK